MLQGPRCGCLKSIESLQDTEQLNDCSATNALAAYSITHLKSNTMAPELQVTLPTTRLEVFLPIKFDIQFLNTESTNFKTYVDFGNDLEKIHVIGKPEIFAEFPTPGKRTVNITSVSLSNPNVILSKQIEVNVLEKINSEPMYSIKLVISENDRIIYANMIISGGDPYSCQVVFGDNSETIEFKSTGRTTSKVLAHEYTLSGLYKIEVNCQSNLIENSLLSDSQLVYIRGKDSSELVNFKQTYLTRSTQEVTLELPFETCTDGLKLQVIDHLSDKAVSEWTCQSKSAKTISLKLNLLSSLLENYISVRFADNIQISSYLFTLEDEIEVKPVIKVLTEKYHIDIPVEVEVTVPVYIDSMIRVDFGDGKDSLTYQINEDKPGENYKFKIEHTYNQRNDLKKVCICFHFCILILLYEILVIKFLKIFF